MKIEACVTSLEEALIAESKGVDRIELTATLENGGATPSMGLIKSCVQHLKIDVHVLIKPAKKSFEYSTMDYEVMIEDIKACANIGVKAIVIGGLDRAGRISQQIYKCVRIAKNHRLKVIFHKAIDLTPNIFESIETLVLWNIDGVLTSGGIGDARSNFDKLSEIQNRFHGKIECIAAGDIHDYDLPFLHQIHMDALHFYITEAKTNSNKNSYSRINDIMNSLKINENSKIFTVDISQSIEDVANDHNVSREK